MQENLFVLMNAYSLAINLCSSDGKCVLMLSYIVILGKLSGGSVLYVLKRTMTHVIPFFRVSTDALIY